MKKILIVDDERTLVEILKNKFNKSGFQIVVAYDGEEGLKKIKEEKPDLVLLDVVMPKMDGITMLQVLRQGKLNQDTPVILLTNLDDAGRVAEAAKLGVYDFLVKADWHIDDVVKKVREKIGE